ncbi:hypothetical protein BJ170DRAFT_213377 [Xylariales sp. AK1849]|nr:hypothetical protein BJ170DRAFT_213377 [Xylariales sp. AK1849]
MHVRIVLQSQPPHASTSYNIRIADYPKLGLCGPTTTVAVTGKPTAITTASMASDGASHTVVVISGGPITAPITIPEASPTKLDPTGTDVQSSVASISSEIAGAMPLFSSWADSPDATKASSAIGALITIIPQVGGLTNNLPNGNNILNNCTATGDGLVYELNNMFCELVDLLGQLENGQQTADPTALGPSVDGIRSDADQVQSDMSSVAVLVPITTADFPTSTSTTVVPVTMTTLPSGASILTLTDYPGTTPVYITTTSPGGNEATVVPVIFPNTGPPEICFGCYITFPPNIEIQVPEFCIQLFGLKIGNCPKDDGNPTQNPTQNPTETPTESCSTTITATYESVFCVVTDSAQAPNTPCSTQAYSLVTGCTVAASMTTTTTIIKPTTPLLCSPDTCGGGSCHIARSLPGVETDHVGKHGNAKRGQPDEGDWVDDDDYTSHDKFVAGEVYEAYNEAYLETNDHVVKFPAATDPDAMMTTSETIQFGTEVASIMVQGLYGCTSVAVVSQRGAWVSHIWEPSFTDALFQTKGMDYILNGLTSDSPQYQQHMYGLTNLRATPQPPTILVKFSATTLLKFLERAPISSHHDDASIIGIKWTKMAN